MAIRKYSAGEILHEDDEKLDKTASMSDADRAAVIAESSDDEED